MSCIADRIRCLTVGEALTRAGLTVYLFLPEATLRPDCLPRDETLATEYACVREISVGGTVATVTFVNDLEQPVLLHGGDLRVDTEQNGVFALSVVVPAQADIIFSEAGVEVGYGGYQAHLTFSAASHRLYTNGRAHIARSEFESLRRRRQPQGFLGMRPGFVPCKHGTVGAGESDRFDTHRISGGAPTRDERSAQLHAFAADADPLSGLKYGPLNELIF